MRGLPTVSAALVFSILAVVAACHREPSPPDPRVEAERRLEAGLLELAGENFEEAEAQFAKAHKLLPLAPETLACLVMMHFVRAKSEEARALLDRNAAMERKHPQIVRLQAVLPDAGAPEHEEIPEPTAAVDHFLVGTAALAERNPAGLKRALEAFDAAVRLAEDAKTPRLLYFVAKATAALRDQAFETDVTAWRVMESVGDRWEHAATAWALKGLVLQRFRRHVLSDRVVASFGAALEIDPDFLLPRCRIGFLKGGFGDLDGALTVFEEAARRRPEQARWRLEIGSVQRHLGRLDEAIASYRTALERQPGLVEARRGLVSILFQRADLDGVVEQCEAALEVNARLPYFHLFLGLAASRRGALDEAFEHYTECIRLARRWAPAHANLGSILFSKGKWKDAKRCFRRAFDLARNQAPVKRNLKRCENALRLESDLEAFVAGAQQPETAEDAICVAEMAYITKRYAAATRLFVDAFARDSSLRKDQSTDHRRFAIWAAIRAANGEGRDTAALDEVGRSRHRAKAIAWFDADLEEKEKLAKDGKLDKQHFARDLQFWRHHPAYAPLRDEAALAKLAADERESCRALWRRVDAFFELMKKKHGF